MPTPQKAAFLRPALAPGLLAAVALIAGVVLTDSSLFIGFRYVVTILAVIIVWFAYRGRGWVWIPLLAAIAVLWNPVWIVPIGHAPFQYLQFVAAAVFVGAGLYVKVPSPEAVEAGRGGSAGRTVGRDTGSGHPSVGQRAQPRSGKGSGGRASKGSSSRRR